MNETLKLIKNRYSCRSFTGNLPERMPSGEAISEKELLNAIALAGIQAPSGINRQCWRVIVVSDKDLISELEQEGLRQLKLMEDQSFYNRIAERGGTLFYNAPVIVFLPIDPTNLIATALDCGIITENVTLAAASLGLGSCICGLAGLALKDPEKAAYFKKRLKFPEGYEFGSAVLVGESAKKTPPHIPDEEKIIFID